MYNRIKEKFSLNESDINKLINRCGDYKELFNDYESSCLQIAEYETDIELYNHYKVLIEELEEEINRIILKHILQSREQ